MEGIYSNWFVPIFIFGMTIVVMAFSTTLSLYSLKRERVGGALCGALASIKIARHSLGKDLSDHQEMGMLRERLTNVYMKLHDVSSAIEIDKNLKKDFSKQLESIELLHQQLDLNGRVISSYNSFSEILDSLEELFVEVNSELNSWLRKGLYYKFSFGMLVVAFAYFSYLASFL